MTTRKEISHGIVPFHKTQEGAWQVLLVHHQKGHWAFPKGHSELEESSRDTAIRELAEETGITDAITSREPVAHEMYTFTEEGKTIEKHVIYFLGIVNDPTVSVQEAELSDAQWMGKEAATQKITFPESREALEAAWEVLEHGTFDE